MPSKKSRKKAREIGRRKINSEDEVIFEEKGQKD
jgi:hypothetical protein